MLVRMRYSVLSLMVIGVLVACNTTPTPITTPLVPQPTQGGNPLPIPTSSGPGVAYPEATAMVAEAYPIPADVKAPVDAPKPEAGKAAISGLLYSYNKSLLVSTRDIYLAPAAAGVPNPLDVPVAGAVTSKSDEEGVFGLNQIPPGQYYLMVHAPNNTWVVARTSANDQKPKVIELAADQSLPLGILAVLWP